MVLQKIEIAQNFSQISHLLPTQIFFQDDVKWFSKQLLSSIF